MKLFFSVLSYIQRILIHSSYIRKITGTDLLLFGTCEFFGDEAVINKIKSSLEVLKNIDQDFYIKLQNFRSTFIQTRKSYYVNTSNDIYSVFDRTVRWGEYGILSCIHNAYCSKCMDPKQSLNAQIEWMKKLDFPKDLIEPKIKRLNTI